MKNISKYYKYFGAIVAVFVSSGAYAQSDTTATWGSTTDLFYMITIMVLVVSILVLIVAAYALKILKTIIGEEMGLEEARESWWSRFKKRATDAVPVEKEGTVILDHNYDGIRELDNHLPPWWRWLFYFTIGFAIVYLAVYHVFNLMPLQTEQYQNQVAQAKVAAEAVASKSDSSAESITAENVVFSDDPTTLSNGKSVFTQCAACHGPDGGGGIGPNLTDKYWLHGGSIKDIFTTITNGVPEKGMIAWQGVLSPTQIRDVASYVLSLQGTSPANPKAPQGELYQGDSMDNSAKTDSAGTGN